MNISTMPYMIWRRLKDGNTVLELTSGKVQWKLPVQCGRTRSVMG